MDDDPVESLFLCRLSLLTGSGHRAVAVHSYFDYKQQITLDCSESSFAIGALPRPHLPLGVGGGRRRKKTSGYSYES